MGLVVDSSVIVHGERAGITAEAIIQSLITFAGDQRAVLSSIGVVEIVHGIYRSPTSALLARRLAFLDDLLALLDVVSFTREVALLAGRIDAEQRKKGPPVPFSDLLIGATALEIGYSLLTLNVAHFALIPGLQVIDYGR